ncbi:MAG: hypothetical protein KDD44_03065, partial [Bdellovibrionales bacterium]|nr:hypothetical protein [Bdellovibrionales bacterium]
EQKQQLARLEEFIGDSDLLQARAKKKRDELRERLEEMQQSRRSSADQVKKLISELDLLGRITKQGKAVDLARRVAAREAKWYLANWRAGEDSSGLEEYILQTATVDPKQLQEEYARAREKRSLQREAEEEQIRIAELEARVMEEQQRGLEQPEGTTDGERGFWNRLWGRIK